MSSESIGNDQKHKMNSREHQVPLENVIKVAKAYYQVPYAFIAILEEDQSWSVVGDASKFNRQNSFFFKMLSGDVVCSNENDLGIPVKDASGENRAIFCIPDHHSRKFCETDLEMLAVFREQIRNIMDSVRLIRLVRHQNEVIIQNSRLATLGQMTTELVHEINNSIAVVLARLEFMQIHAGLGKLSSQMTSESVDQLMSSTRHLIEIIKRVKSFARKMDHDPSEEVEVQQMLEYSLSFCLDRLKRERVKILKDQLPLRTKVNCRTIQISQVLVNLINNAIDATKGLPDPWVRMQAEETATHILIRVTDCGLGINGDLSEKIFLPFFTTKNKTHGTGLGLSISKNIMESHHGDLRYEFFEGHTSFLVSLPREVSDQSTETIR